MTYLRVSLVALVAVVLAAIGQTPTAPTNPTANRIALDAALSQGGTATLPAGVVPVDRPPTLTSGSTLRGDPKGSTLIVTGWAPTLKVAAAGLGYAEVGHVDTPMQIGDWVYRYLFDWQYAGTVRPQLCRVTAMSSRTTYTTVPPPHPQHNAILRFRKAWPCGQPKEGDTSVSLSDVPAVGLVAGMSVYVTDGPSVADAARGEHRRIVRVAGNTVTLDRPLRLNYGPAVLADIAAIEGATIQDCTIDAPANGNPVTWAAMFKGCVGLKVNRVRFTGAADLVACGDAVVSDCSGPALQLNTTVGCRVERCRFGALYCEEATSDVDVVDCEFGGPQRHPDANCVTGHFHCDRLRFYRCRVVGAGRAQWPPPGAFSLSGRDIRLIDCEVTASRGGASGVQGDGLTIRGLTSDAALFVYQPTQRASLAQIRGSYVELVDGTAGVAVDVAKIKAGTGWQQVACEAWAPQGAQAIRRPPAPVPQRSPIHERLRGQR